MEGSIDTALSAVQVAKDRRVLACQVSGFQRRAVLSCVVT